MDLTGCWVLVHGAVCVLRADDERIDETNVVCRLHFRFISVHSGVEDKERTTQDRGAEMSTKYVSSFVLILSCCLVFSSCFIIFYILFFYSLAPFLDTNEGSYHVGRNRSNIQIVMDVFGVRFS